MAVRAELCVTRTRIHTQGRSADDCVHNGYSAPCRRCQTIFPDSIPGMTLAPISNAGGAIVIEVLASAVGVSPPEES